MIDIANDDVFPVSEAPRHIPGRPSQATVWRWVLTGVGGIKLESILIGGRRNTSTASIQEFCDQRTAAADGDTPPVRTLRQREREITAAERGCEHAGF